MFSNKGGTEEVTIKLDGLEYKILCPTGITKERIGQSIIMDSKGTEATMEKAIIYPKRRANNGKYNSIY